MVLKLLWSSLGLLFAALGVLSGVLFVVLGPPGGSQNFEDFSHTKPRVGDTTRIQKSMFGKGEERRFRAEIRLGDSGARVLPAFFVVLSSLVASQFPNETSIGRHH